MNEEDAGEADCVDADNDDAGHDYDELSSAGSRSLIEVMTELPVFSNTLSKPRANPQFTLNPISTSIDAYILPFKSP